MDSASLGLSFFAREPHDKARALPQLDTIDELGGLANGLLIVWTINNVRRAGDVPNGSSQIDTVVRRFLQRVRLTMAGGDRKRCSILLTPQNKS